MNQSFADKFEYNVNSPWQWRRASGADVVEIVNMAKQFFEHEIDKIFTPDPIIMARQVTLACVRQFYDPKEELLIIARDKTTGKLLAYTWVQRGQYACWAFDEIAEVRMAHVDMTLSNRDRVTLLAQMLCQWEFWAVECGVPVLCSTTVRAEQKAFLKLHEQADYSVRGSYAYKRVISPTSE